MGGYTLFVKKRIFFWQKSWYFEIKELSFNSVDIIFSVSSRKYIGKERRRCRMKKFALIAGLIGLIGMSDAEAGLYDMIHNIPSYSDCSFSQRRDFCHEVSVQCPNLNVKWINLFSKWENIANDANAIAIAVQKGYYDLAKHLIDIRTGNVGMDRILLACRTVFQNINGSTQGNTLNQTLLPRDEEIEKLGDFLSYLRPKIQFGTQEGTEFSALFGDVVNQYGTANGNTHPQAPQQIPDFDQNEVNRFWNDSSIQGFAGREGIQTVKELFEVAASQKIKGSLVGVAIQNDCPNIALFFIDQMRDINVELKNGYTLLQFAAWKGWSNIVAKLIEKRADLNKQDRFNCSALHYAVLGKNPEIVRLLIGADASKSFLNKKDHFGRTALHAAAAVGDPGLVRILVDAGADESLMALNGKTALDMAKHAYNRSSGDIRDRYQQIINILK